MPKKPSSDHSHRKIIGFDAEDWMALQLLARDRMSSFQELADEAFRDLLKKHNRPVTLNAALKQSLRSIAANETAPLTETPKKMLRRKGAKPKSP